MKVKRQAQLNNYITQHGICSYKELMTHFDVSPSTIRRDIEQLVILGAIEKRHGGVVARSIEQSDITTSTQNLSPATITNDSKDAIARKASYLVNDNEVIFLGSGSTVAYMVPYLKDRHGITIISNNLLVITAAAHYNLTSMIIGGTLNSETMSVVGFQSLAQLRTLNVNKAFIGCNGITLSGCITNTSEAEAHIKREVMKISNKCYLLTEHSKFDQMALYTFADLRDFTATITDQYPSHEFMDMYQHIGQEIIIASPVC